MYPEPRLLEVELPAAMSICDPPPGLFVFAQKIMTSQLARGMGETAHVQLFEFKNIFESVSLPQLAQVQQLSATGQMAATASDVVDFQSIASTSEDPVDHATRAQAQGMQVGIQLSKEPYKRDL